MLCIFYTAFHSGLPTHWYAQTISIASIDEVAWQNFWGCELQTALLFLYINYIPGMTRAEVTEVYKTRSHSSSVSHSSSLQFLCTSKLLYFQEIEYLCFAVQEVYP